MSHHLLLIVHLIAATIWIGGHLYLCCCILPKAIKQKNAEQILKFETGYEPLGIIALTLLVITGVWMAINFGIKPWNWLSFSSPLERVVSIKLLLLLSTAILALNAQLRVIPQLKSNNQKKLTEMIMHIVGVTFIGIAMLVLGTFVRYGGI